MQEVLRIEARSAGLRTYDVSLPRVERRRLELWTLGVLVVSTLSLLAALAPERVPGADLSSVTTVRMLLGSLAALFIAYVVEKELHLRRLSVLLHDERLRVARLEDIDALKSEFLNLVSHELKTPLTSVIGAVDILRRRDMNEGDRRELLETAHRQSQRLAEMVGQLLSAGDLLLEARIPAPPVDLAGLARRVVSDFERSGRPVGVTAPGPSFVHGHEDALEHVLWNLLDNAYKYGDAPVDVEVRAEDGVVVLRVTDSGGGVPAADRERVFEQFERRAGTDRPGLGLGLAIVRRIVEASGGRVWIEDAPGGGAGVNVALAPAEPPPPSSRDGLDASAPSDAGAVSAALTGSGS